MVLIVIILIDNFRPLRYQYNYLSVSEFILKKFHLTSNDS